MKLHAFWLYTLIVFAGISVVGVPDFVLAQESCSGLGYYCSENCAPNHDSVTGTLNCGANFCCVPNPPIEPAQCGENHFKCDVGQPTETRTFTTSYSWQCDAGDIRLGNGAIWPNRANCSETRQVTPPPPGTTDCIQLGHTCETGTTCTGVGSQRVTNGTCPSGNVCCTGEPQLCSSFSGGRCQPWSCQNGQTTQVAGGCASGEYCCLGDPVNGSNQEPQVHITIDTPSIPAPGLVYVRWELLNVPVSNAFVFCQSDNWPRPYPGGQGNNIIPRTGVTYQFVNSTWQFGVSCYVSRSGTTSTDQVRYSDIATVVVGGVPPPYTQCSNKGGVCRPPAPGCLSGETQIPISTYCPTGNPREVCCVTVTAQSTCVDAGGICTPNSSSGCGTGTQLGTCESGQLCCKGMGNTPPSTTPPSVPPSSAPPTTPPPAVFTTPFTFGNPVAFSTVDGLFSRILSFLQATIVLLSLIFIIIGAFLYITSAGDEGRMTQGKKAILAALIGLALGIAAPAFLREIASILGWGTPNLPSGVGTSLTLIQIATNVLNFLLTIIGILAIIMLVIGGIMYLTAAGNEDTLDKGKKIVKYSLIGITIALASLVLVKAVAGLLS